jgi:alpha-tubulin suppressor-like RCC1 family protein
MVIFARFKDFLHCNMAALLVGLAVVALPVAMQTPQRANAAAMTGFSQVEASNAFGCALKTGGTVWCWGHADLGKLGNGRQGPVWSPQQVTGVSGVTQIALGSGFGCALKSTGIVVCWGNGTSGETGSESDTEWREALEWLPVYNLTGVSQITAGHKHACGLKTNGTIWCWGLNTWGNLGNGNTTNQKYRVAAASGITTATQIMASESATCALLSDQTVRCWGEGIALGYGSTSNSLTPVQPTGLTGVTKLLDANGDTMCAIKTDTTLWCWGKNNNGQLGIGNTTNQLTPVQVSSLSGVASGSASVNHTCVLLSDGTPRCWGWNPYRQLGNGTVVNSTVPTAVTGVTGVAQLSSGEGQTCAVLQVGTIKCWGGNSQGELGNGNNIERTVPVFVLSSFSLLATPASVTATATASTLKSINVSWGAVANANSYTVKLYDSAGTTVLGTQTGLSATSTTITSAAYASIADNTTYKVTVTAVAREDDVDYQNSSEGAKVSVTTNSPSATPVISSQPVAATRTAGQSVTFSVTASATDGGTLSYQWLKDGANISSATSSSYTINPLATTDAGSLSVRVTNSASGRAAASTTSSAVALTVASALSIATPTTGLSGTANSAFSLVVAGSGGSGTLSYALTGTLVSGLSFATSTGTISGTPTVAGSSTVSVRVTDANGAIATTSNFTVAIGYASTTVSLALASSSPQYGVTNRITATTSRAGTVNFMLGGTTISGCGAVAAATTTAVCDWVPTALGAASLSATFTPTSSTAYANSTGSLSTTVAARAITVTPTASQSKLFGAADPGIAYSITSGSLYGSDSLAGALSRATGEDAGTYAITVGTLANANYAITLASVNFTIRGAGTPTISSQPASANKTTGQSVTFSVTAASPDTGGLSYQWRKDGVAILSGTSASYTINSVATSDAGSFTVVVSNSINNGLSTSVASTTSSAATLTVATALSIATPAAGLSGTAHSSFSLVVTGSGGRTTLSYALTGTLVSGLSFATSTGTISGTPTVAGSAVVSVTVTDANGATASTSNFTITIGYASTTVSLALASASPQYGLTNRITATTSRAGTVNFMLGGTTVSGCGAVAAASTTATCDWVPVSLGAAALSATFTPTASTAYANSTTSLSSTVVGRAITVTPTAGQSKLFGATDPDIAYSITSGSMYGSETLTGALSRVPGEDAGSYAITGGTLSNANYAITLAPVNFSITQANQATVVLSTTSGVYATGLTLAASGGSGTGAYSFAVASAGTAGCSITSGVLSATSPGTCAVTATRALSTNYVSASSVATTVTIGKATQAVVTLTSTSGTFNTNISLAASGGTGSGSYAFSVSDAGVAVCSLVTSTSLTSTGAGSCTVTVTRAGDDYYEPRSSSSTTVTFAKDSQSSLSIRDLSGDLDTGISLATTGGTGTGAVSYSVTSGTANCSISSGVASARYAGSCSLTATKAADANYLQKQVTGTLTFIKATQASLVVTSVSGTYGTPITLTTSGGSGAGTVLFALSDAGTASCSVSGSLLSFTAVGTCRVTATRDADSVFDSRSSASTTITIDRADQPALSTATTSGDLVTGIIVSVTGGAGTGALSTSVTTGTANCTLAGGVVAARANGTCVLTISKLGDTNYNAASATVTLTFAKAVAARGTLGSPTTGTAGTGITLSFTGGSGTGAVTYSLVSPGTAGCSITNGVLNATTGGKCSVVITKQGDETYADQTTTVEFTFTAPPSASQGQSEVAAVTTTTSTTTTTTTVVARVVGKKSKVTPSTPEAKVESTSTTTTSPKSSMPIKQLVAPTLVNTPSAVGAATIGGKTVKATTTRVNNQLVFNSGGFTVTLAGVKADGTIIPLSSDGLLEVQRGDTFRLDATGFAPGSNVDIWMFSKSMLMANITVGADGLVKSSFKVPKSMSNGLHHLVMVGIDKAKAEAKFEMGLNVGAPVKQWWASRVLIVIPIAVAVFIGLWLPTTVRRRKRRQLV